MSRHSKIFPILRLKKNVIRNRVRCVHLAIFYLISLNYGAKSCNWNEFIWLLAMRMNVFIGYNAKEAEKEMYQQNFAHSYWPIKDHLIS